MTDIEADVVAMLRRRAADISDEPAVPADVIALDGHIDLGAGIDATHPANPTDRTDPTGRRASDDRRLPRWVLAGAAAALLVAAGLAGAVGLTGRNSSPVGEEPATAIEAGAGTTTLATDPPQPPPASAPDPTLADIIDSLPSSVPIEDGLSFVFVDPSAEDVDGLVRSYLADRLPDLVATVEPKETIGPLTHHRWTADKADIQLAGSVVTREGSWLPAVVLATTDGMAVTTVERTTDSLTVTVSSPREEDLVADVRTPLGETVPGAPNPDGVGPDGSGSGPPIGTAGTTDGNTLQVGLPVGAGQVVVRAQNIGGTNLSLLEFPVGSVGFAEPCGTTPPLTIDVGQLLGDLADGPAPQTTSDPLPGQMVWHHPGEQASIELRWPPDPSIFARLPPESYPSTAENAAVHFIGRDPRRLGEPAPPGPAAQHVLGRIDDTIDDPCAVVQISVRGQRDHVEWWSQALSGQWSFGLPLSIAGLDPAAESSQPGDAPANDEDAALVVGEAELDDPPRVPATGSCDGLPDDPPRTSAGPFPLSDSPTGALRAFLDDPTLDLGDGPPLPTSGYTAVSAEPPTIHYTIPFDQDLSGALVVVAVGQVDDGWKVTGWEAARC